MGYVRIEPLVAAVTVLVLVLTCHQLVAGECQADRRTLHELLPCASAVVDDSDASPTSSCCDAVRSRGLPCLCSIYEQYRTRIPTHLNQTKIKNIPKECNVSVPAGYTCGGEVIPY